MNFNKEVSQYIQQGTTQQIELLNSLRLLIHQSVPNTTEAIKWKMPVFAQGKDFAYFRIAKKHITFGFYNIDKIEDPDNLLEGTGTSLKHVKIRTNKDIDSDLFSKWLKAIAS